MRACGKSDMVKWFKLSCSFAHNFYFEDERIHNVEKFRMCFGIKARMSSKQNFTFKQENIKSLIN